VSGGVAVAVGDGVGFGFGLSGAVVPSGVGGVVGAGEGREFGYRYRLRQNAFIANPRARLRLCSEGVGIVGKS
jgi:hypothetical protein